MNLSKSSGTGMNNRAVPADPRQEAQAPCGYATITIMAANAAIKNQESVIFISIRLFSLSDFTLYPKS
jgi:hypothetical protein